MFTMIRQTVMTISKLWQRTRFHLRDRCGATERPLISYEEKTQTHDTLPKSLLSRSAEIVVSKLLVSDYVGIHMGGLCYELAQKFPTPFSWDMFSQVTFLHNAMEQSVLFWTIFHLAKHLKNSIWHDITRRQSTKFTWVLRILLGTRIVR